MKSSFYLSTFLVLTVFCCTMAAQTPIWQGKGRIAISSDGNEHDHDDWAATPLSLALLAAAGLQDQLVLYTYSDHVWGSNQNHPTSQSGLNSYEHMRESSLGGQKWFGFDRCKFICAVDNAEVAYTALRDEINRSSEDNPLIIVAAGPMQVVGEAISRADKDKRQNVTLVSHSDWNNEHSDYPGKDKYWDVHSGWTFQEIKDQFSASGGGNLKCIKILDQNGGEDYEGLKADVSKFDWIKNSPARNNPLYKEGAWDWLYTRLETCIKDQGKEFDPSDAGMIVYLLTGEEKTDPGLARNIMENPVPTATRLTEIWSSEAVLNTCESVLYDEERNQLFVSCINGSPSEKNGKGFISLLEPDGTIKTLEWISGLNAPKGMAIYKGELYVADLDELVVINIKKAKISRRILVPGASFLNDVAVGADGKIYFSDSDTGSIWIYAEGKSQKWITEGLNRPNGLYVEDQRVLLASSASSDLKVIDKATGKAEVVVSQIGHGDGVEFTGKEGYYLISSWSGELFLIFPDYTKMSLLKTSDQEINSADIGFNVREQVVYVPTFFDNRVVAYKLHMR